MSAVLSVVLAGGLLLAASPAAAQSSDEPVAFLTIRRENQTVVALTGDNATCRAANLSPPCGSQSAAELASAGWRCGPTFKHAVDPKFPSYRLDAKRCSKLLARVYVSIWNPGSTTTVTVGITTSSDTMTLFGRTGLDQYVYEVKAITGTLGPTTRTFNELIPVSDKRNPPQILDVCADTSGHIFIEEASFAGRAYRARQPLSRLCEGTYRGFQSSEPLQDSNGKQQGVTEGRQAPQEQTEPDQTEPDQTEPDDAAEQRDTSALEADIEARIDKTAANGDTHSNRVWRAALAAVRGEPAPDGAPAIDKARAQRAADRAGAHGNQPLAQLWQRIADNIN